MSNSDRMVLLHLNIKSFALDLYRIIVIQTSFITYVIEIPTSYLKFEIKKKLLKATLEYGNNFDERHVQK